MQHQRRCRRSQSPRQCHEFEPIKAIALRSAPNTDAVTTSTPVFSPALSRFLWVDPVAAAGMEARARRSAERPRTRPELPASPPSRMILQKRLPLHEQGRTRSRHTEGKQLPAIAKVPVVYYLCGGRQLEHPHFIEVPVSSPRGLYLRDVIKRLGTLRGKGMAGMYSWSCKMNYKNGFVWHDLSDDDLIQPCNGTEYVLKGSELFDSAPPDRGRESSGGSTKQLQQQAGRLQLTSRRNESTSPSSSSPEGIRLATTPRPPSTVLRSPPGLLPPPRRDTHLSLGSNARFSSSSGTASSSGSRGVSPGFSGHKQMKPSMANAGTQTDAARRRAAAGPDSSRRSRKNPYPKQSPEAAAAEVQEIEEEEIAKVIAAIPPASKSVPESPTSGTLQALIRAEAHRISTDRPQKKSSATTPRLRAADVLVQLVTCGSLSVKGVGRRHCATVGMPPPLPILGELDGSMDREVEEGKPRRKFKGRECYSGSLIEINRRRGEDGRVEGGAADSLARCSSCSADR